MSEMIKVHHARMGEFEVTPSKEFDDWWEEYGSSDLKKIYCTFGMEVFRRSACLYGFNKFLKDNKVRGKRCLEIGTLNGLTAVVLSRYFDEVVTIDIVDNTIKHKVFSRVGVNNVKCHVVKSNDEKGELINSLDFDFCYSDANHAVDTERDFNWVKRCGRVAFHEYWPLQPPLWELVNELRKTGTVSVSGLYALWIANG